MSEWDPVGAAGIPEAQDEYDSYIPAVHGKLTGHAPEKDITEFLAHTEAATMGVTGNLQRVKRTVQALLRLRDELESTR
jgi:hypothetical protein